MKYCRLNTEKRRSRTALVIRNRYFLWLDVVALLFIPALALTLRVDGLDWWPTLSSGIIVLTSLALLVKVPIFYLAGLYCRYWPYASVNDLCTVAWATCLSTSILMVFVLGMHHFLGTYDLTFSRALPLLDGVLTVFAVGGTRFAVRGLYHWQRQYRGRRTNALALVVGAGEAGTMVVREMRANPESGLEPLAFVDDDLLKVGTHIQGLPVMGTTADIPMLVSRYAIQRIVVAIPSAPLKRQKRLVSMCEQTGVMTECLPGVYQLLAGHKTVSPFAKINIDQFLEREPIVVDASAAGALLGGQTVVITGAGGSIGSELCHQIARLHPAALVLLGHGENSIFEVHLALRSLFPELRIHQEIADIRNRRRIDAIMEKYRPSAVFHAAAHKHVPFMQDNAEEAITNNIFGTHNVVLAAEKYGVERFVLISTDKAINPANTMGATKRTAELLVMGIAQRSKHHYMVVRFGNVLGSRGSVIPIFQRQIASGGPLTITHPDMVRYFMTIPEAVQLVLQASVLGQGGEVFILDMGKPVRIADLATKLIELSGLKPGLDISLQYTGVRPGEKLQEELFMEGEHYCQTKHQRILVAKNENVLDINALESQISKFRALIEQGKSEVVLGQMQAILTLDKIRPELSTLSDDDTFDSQPILLKTGTD